MLLLGIDLGTSAVKVSVVDAATQQVLAAVSYPETERPIVARRPGWAEQDPAQWWHDVQQAIRKAHATGAYDPRAIGAIGLAYQMHGLVLVDKDQQVLRDAIIWCDSRAVPYGEAARAALGPDYCRTHLLNSPGNFTAAKLAWVQANEPALYAQIDKVLLPGDFLALRLIGAATTSPAALSEGVFWDFARHEPAAAALDYFGFDKRLLPPVRDVFADHGRLTAAVAAELGLTPGIPVAYKAGDQPNNALALNVLQPGEVAATAGTSGVIYAVTDKLFADAQSRVNAFAHVNHAREQPRLGVLLCLNGAGSLHRWVRGMVAPALSYAQANARAARVPVGSAGLLCLPFGNGAERVLENRQIGAHFLGLDLNRHGPDYLLRAGQEGVACAFRYGLDVLRAGGLTPAVVKAGYANLFLSDVFSQAFADVTGLAVELYRTDGSVGAALGAGIGAGAFATVEEAFARAARLRVIEPGPDAPAYAECYRRWERQLAAQLRLAAEAGDGENT